MGLFINLNILHTYTLLIRTVLMTSSSFIIHFYIIYVELFLLYKFCPSAHLPLHAELHLIVNVYLILNFSLTMTFNVELLPNS